MIQYLCNTFEHWSKLDAMLPFLIHLSHCHFRLYQSHFMKHHASWVNPDLAVTLCFWVLSKLFCLSLLHSFCLS